MTRYVIDASAAAEYLLRTTLGLKLAGLIEGAFLLAPELLDVEVLSVLRRAVLHRRPIDRVSHTALVLEAWRHRSNVSAYDAFYVAAARLYDASLLTSDGPLARAPALGIVIQNIRMA